MSEICGDDVMDMKNIRSWVRRSEEGRTSRDSIGSAFSGGKKALQKYSQLPSNYGDVERKYLRLQGDFIEKLLKFDKHMKRRSSLKSFNTPCIYQV